MKIVQKIKTFSNQPPSHRILKPYLLKIEKQLPHTAHHIRHFLEHISKCKKASKENYFLPVPFALLFFIKTIHLFTSLDQSLTHNIVYPFSSHKTHHLIGPSRNITTKIESYPIHHHRLVDEHQPRDSFSCTIETFALSPN